MDYKEGIDQLYSTMAELFFINFVKYVLPPVLFVLAMLFATRLVKYILSNLFKNNTVSNSNVSLTCPRCGSKLVLRTAKKGSNAGQQFYGCSAYPKCRYTRK